MNMLRNLLGDHAGSQSISELSASPVSLVSFLHVSFSVSDKFCNNSILVTKHQLQQHQITAVNTVKCFIATTENAFSLNNYRLVTIHRKKYGEKHKLEMESQVETGKTFQCNEVRQLLKLLQRFNTLDWPSATVFIQHIKLSLQLSTDILMHITII